MQHINYPRNANRPMLVGDLVTLLRMSEDHSRIVSTGIYVLEEVGEKKSIIGEKWSKRKITLSNRLITPILPTKAKDSRAVFRRKIKDSRHSEIFDRRHYAGFVSGYSGNISLLDSDKDISEQFWTLDTWPFNYGAIYDEKFTAYPSSDFEVSKSGLMTVLVMVRHQLNILGLADDKVYCTLDKLERKIESLNDDDYNRSVLNTILRLYASQTPWYNQRNPTWDSLIVIPSGDDVLTKASIDKIFYYENAHTLNIRHAHSSFVGWCTALIDSKRYLVSTEGRLWDIANSSLVPTDVVDDKLVTTLYLSDNLGQVCEVSSLVYASFRGVGDGNYTNGVCHLDGDDFNNRLSNLDPHKNPRRWSNVYSVLDLETGEDALFSSIREISDKYCVSHRAITHALTNCEGYLGDRNVKITTVAK